MTSQIYTCQIPVATRRRFDYRSHDIISTPNNRQKKLKNYFFKMAANVIFLVDFHN
ncbi:hypothetical protein Hdeb2414_s0003g00095211 [Helianthus debilis subsp. tardiflorus]